MYRVSVNFKLLFRVSSAIWMCCVSLSSLIYRLFVCLEQFWCAVRRF